MLKKKERNPNYDMFLTSDLCDETFTQKIEQYLKYW